MIWPKQLLINATRAIVILYSSPWRKIYHLSLRINAICPLNTFTWLFTPETVVSHTKASSLLCLTYPTVSNKLFQSLFTTNASECSKGPPLRCMLA